MSSKAGARDATPPGREDMVMLSRRLVETRGWAFLMRVRPGEHSDFSCFDWDRIRPVVVACVAPAGLFAAIMRLLDDPPLAAQVRRGLGVEVHSWSRRGDAYLCQVIELKPEDFGLQPRQPDGGGGHE